MGREIFLALQHSELKTLPKASSLLHLWHQEALGAKTADILQEQNWQLEPTIPSTQLLMTMKTHTLLFD